jgi:hypothetical protein
VNGSINQSINQSVSLPTNLVFYPEGTFLCFLPSFFGVSSFQGAATAFITVQFSSKIKTEISEGLWDIRHFFTL